MNVYEQAERELSEAREAFSSAFGGTENAAVIKSQRNDFALRFKYPLLMLVCAVIVAAVVVIQVVFKQFDALYIVCECIICLAMAACIVLFAITWYITRRNARAAEAITYYSPEPGKRFLYTEIAGGGEKIEWADACLYLRGDAAELFEGNGKQYSPFLYKKVRGHSRGYALFDLGNILGNFMDGCDVISHEGNVWRLSSGFSFAVAEDGTLAYFEIKGMYDECYENNFPLYAPFSVSRSYVFTYRFTAVNAPNFRMHLPDITRTACDFYFVPPPDDPRIVVPK